MQSMVLNGNFQFEEFRSFQSSSYKQRVNTLQYKFNIRNQKGFNLISKISLTIDLMSMYDIVNHCVSTNCYPLFTKLMDRDWTIKGNQIYEKINKKS
ncbi:hypothetical protein RCL_jg12868.t1 [Rhizophagus clarus]|uniref:Uncharacterized protein n=1 Tax=Rhizophagus clarus TaxID=94130 RepID=A0A8H3QE01_9GLOM|nr:hypothetical protein RCL_jg12868.t1 [Rhizophagus clarus]